MELLYFISCSVNYITMFMPILNKMIIFYNFYY